MKVNKVLANKNEIVLRILRSCSVYKNESDSNESTESQLCNPIYLASAWLPLDS